MRLSAVGPLTLKRVLCVVAGGALLLAAFSGLRLLASFDDRSTATTELAMLHADVERIALAAEIADRQQDPAVLERAIDVGSDNLDHLRIAALPLTDRIGPGALARLQRTWATTIRAARDLVANQGDSPDLVAATDAVNASIADLMARFTALESSHLAFQRRATFAGLTAFAVGALAALGAFRLEVRSGADLDPLTGALSRDRFHRLLGRTLRRRTPGRQVAVILIDIDRFRRINQTLGVRDADRVLRDLPRRVGSALPPGAVIARRGGDEFLVLVDDCPRDQARDLADAVLEALDRPLIYGSGQVRVGVSIGLALAPDDGEDRELLLDAADHARDDAKLDGGGTYRFARGDAPPTRSGDALQLELELRRALEREEFELFYQPQVDVHSGDIVGAEALLRWHSPNRGLVDPDRFIPLLEESRLIVPVGAWTIAQATRQARAWTDARGRPFRVAVNVSARQLYQSNLVPTVRKALADAALPANQLELEVTETVAIQNPEEAVRVLEELTAIGVRCALDDFGTGHSWLRHLRLLPTMSMKIDRSFVGGITENPEDLAIVAGLVTVAHTLQRTVVAEGVERAAQLTALEEMHCDVAQGYFFSPPVTARDFSTFLFRKHPWLPTEVSAGIA
jgi:diguanylate cyclase (GGDEF)-like protein